MQRIDDTDRAIAITGRGMVSSLGSVVTACAAAKAGLARPTPLGVRMRSPEDGEPDEVLGHRAGELTLGFEGYARLLRLTALSFGDLLRQVPDEPWVAARAGAYLSLPDPHRVHTGLTLIADESTRAARAEEAREAARAPDPEEPSRLVRTAAQLAGWRVDPPLRFCTMSGHAGVGEALQSAMDDLHRGQVSAAIVGGVDSLVEEETVMWLHNTGRLKRSGVPVGLQPGEAGAFLLLETVRAARARRARPFAIIQAVQIENEDGTLLSGSPARGVALATALAGAACAANLGNVGPVWVVCDHNGESYRAMEWGNALARLAGISPDLQPATIWYPAASFGDVGAASGAVSLCLTIHALHRGGAPARAATIVSSSDGGRRAAVVVRADEPETRSRRA